MVIKIIESTTKGTKVIFLGTMEDCVVEIARRKEVDDGTQKIAWWTEPSWVKFYDPKVAPPGLYKYIKSSDKWYVFAIDYRHDEVAGEVPGTPEAAGYIGVFDDYVKFDDTYSSTLKLGTTGDQERELAELFGKRIKDRYEWP